MKQLLRRIDRWNFEAPLALVLGLAAAFLIMAMPDYRFQTVPVAGDLGWAGQFCSALLLGVVLGGIAYVVMRTTALAPRPMVKTAKRAPVFEPEPEPVPAERLHRLRRADAHPDAPPRAPIMASRDLGEPFMEIGHPEPAAPRRSEVIEGEIVEDDGYDIPHFLREPVATATEHPAESAEPEAEVETDHAAFEAPVEAEQASHDEPLTEAPVAEPEHEHEDPWAAHFDALARHEAASPEWTHHEDEPVAEHVAAHEPLDHDVETEAAVEPWFATHEDEDLAEPARSPWTTVAMDTAEPVAEAPAPQPAAHQPTTTVASFAERFVPVEPVHPTRESLAAMMDRLSTGLARRANAVEPEATEATPPRDMQPALRDALDHLNQLATRRS